MPSIKQFSFSGGEVAPAVYGRSDTAKYTTGLRTLRNFMVMRHGGVTNRPGTKFIAEVKDSTKAVRAHKFVFASDDTFLLEFGDLYVRFFQNQVRLELGAVTGNDTWGFAAIAWLTATAYEQPVVTPLGDLRTNGGVQYDCILSHTSGATSEPGVGAAWSTYWRVHQYTAGQDALGAGSRLYVARATHAPAANNEPGVGAAWATFWYATTGTTSQNIYEVPTPYVTADLATLQFVQSGDVITICHPNYAPRELSRHGTYQWELETISYVPSIDRPTTVAGTGSAGAVAHEYVVTAVKAVSYEESLPGTSGGTAAIITGVNFDTEKTFLVTTSLAHGFANGDRIAFASIAGTGRVFTLNGRGFRVTAVTATTFTVRDDDARGGAAGTYTSGGTATRGGAVVVAAAVAAGAPITMTWTAVIGATEYNIYRKKNSRFGYIGTTAAATFVDDGLTPNLDESPPVERVPFAGTGDYPSTSSYFQQRQLFANTDAATETTWASQVGSYHNLSARSPALADDAFSFTIAGRQVNEIRHLVDIGKLVVFTSGGEWTIQGDADGVLRPSAVNLHQDGFNGAASLAPIVIGNSAVYVQARGTIIRDLRYEFSSDGYPSRDLTIFAAHLFEGYTIVDWDYAQNPHSVVWCVRSDGKLLGLTYVRDHEVWGWHQHDTDGTDTYENVISIPEGAEDAVYVVIKRTIGGATKRYIERFASRFIDNLTDDAWFVDSGVAYDGTSTYTGTLTLTGGTLWAYTENLTLTASAAPSIDFLSVPIGCAFVLTSGTDTVTLTLTSAASPTVCTVRADKTVPASLRSAAVLSAAWSYATVTYTGLTHLEGRTVAVLADGGVEAQAVVAAGTVTLTAPAVKVRIGLPITALMETLDLETLNTETLVDKVKNIKRVTLQVESSRGLFVGPDLANLEEWVQRTDSDGYAVPGTFTGSVEVVLNGTWNDHGRIIIRQTDPLPLSVLAVVPSGEIGG